MKSGSRSLWRTGCAGAAAVLAVPVIDLVAEPAGGRIVVADVPLPRIGPRGHPGDAIGELISGGERSTTGAAAYAPVPDVRPGKTLDSAGFKLALSFLEKGDPAGATLAAYALPNAVDVKLVDWLVATSGNRQVPASRIADVAERLRDWPGQSLLKLRYEQAVLRDDPAPAELVRLLGGSTPRTDDATVALGKAYLALGRRDDAARLIRPFWRDENFSQSYEEDVAKAFSGLLTADDHKARMHRLLYDERTSDALRIAKRLGKNQQALAEAVVTVVRNQRGGQGAVLKALDAVPASVKNDPLYVYSRIQSLRRAGKTDEAARLLAGAPRDPGVIIDPDAWWVERRLISRELIEAGHARLAYEVAAGHSAESPASRAEAEFHAGWYALEFLDDPNMAQRHFAAIAALASMPLSLSRAEYWMGRAAAAAGDRDAADIHFRRAAGYPTTFYGQLALARLGSTRLSLTGPPPADASVHKRFASRELVQAIRHLTAANYQDRANLFHRHLADTLSDPAEISLLADMAAAHGEHQLALQIGKLASARGLPVDDLAFPMTAIPPEATTPRVEKPLVYAIARQESAFNPGAVSGAGARGLLQLMPATAKATARSLGLSYSQAKLTSDPAYNATLGAAHLGSLVEEFNGSYVMTFAAYNAGSSRVRDWVKRFGDPRDPRVDVVNWVELIPFTETRNYVQRIMENLQVYRARLGDTALVIESDLKRGGS